MYSDLGHFTRNAISGSYLLHHPEDADDAFWKAVPSGMFWPMFVAAILASALISGAFSIMRQASMLGLFPKTTVIHTGHHVEGQIYMPEVNYALLVLCVAVTAGFQSTQSLGEAYGWVALLFAFILGSIKMTWWWGTSKKRQYIKQNRV
eukprot:gene13255-13385_t